MIREEKEKSVEELRKVFSEAKALYLTDFTGINVEMISDLRRQFRKENVEYRVVKNTLTRRSIDGMEYNDLMEYLVGPTAIAYSYDDPLAAGKLIDEFNKKNKKLELKAAIIEGEVYDRETAIKIAKLPPKEVLIAKLLGTLISPVSGLVYTLNGIIRNAVSVLDQIRDLKEKQGDAPAAEQESDTPEKEAGASEDTKSETEKPEDVKPKEKKEENVDKAQAAPDAEQSPAEEGKNENAESEQEKKDPEAESKE